MEMTLCIRSPPPHRRLRYCIQKHNFIINWSLLLQSLLFYLLFSRNKKMLVKVLLFKTFVLEIMTKRISFSKRNIKCNVHRSSGNIHQYITKSLDHFTYIVSLKPFLFHINCLPIVLKNCALKHDTLFKIQSHL